MSETPEIWQNIGMGVAFASASQQGYQWFELGFVDSVEQQLRRDLVVFDWWVRNQDREENNTNLLWDHVSKSLLVIDFDASFDPSFFPTFFFNYHVFAKDWPTVSADCLLRSEYEEKLTNALAALQKACDTLPLAWLKDAEASGEFSLEAVRAAIERCKTQEALWKEV